MLAQAPAVLASARGRGAGRGRVVARAVAGRTELAESRAESPLKLLRPRIPQLRAAAVCVVTFGGGLVDGDAIDLRLTVERGATLVVFTQSTTKAFRGRSRQTVRAEVEGTLVFLPDPVACFAEAHFAQRVDVTLGDDGACVLLDGFTSGRAAYGERWAFDGLELRTNVARGEHALLRDAVVLDRRDGAVAPRMGGFEALLTAVAIGERASPVVEGLLEARAPEPGLVVAASPLASCARQAVPGALARVAATTPERALTEARRRLRALPAIGGMDPFASRH